MGGFFALVATGVIVVSVFNLVVGRDSDPTPGIVLVQGLLGIACSAAWISFWGGSCSWVAIGSPELESGEPGPVQLRWNRWFRDASCPASQIVSISNSAWSLRLVIEIQDGPRLRIPVQESLADFLEILLDRAPQARVDVLFPLLVEQRLRSAGDTRSLRWKR